MTPRRHSRKRGLARAARTALGLVTLLLLWGLAEPRLLDVEEETATLPNLPPAWEGRRVAVLGDFQVGMWLGNSGTARRAVARLVADPPAAVLLTGDFLHQADDALDARVAAAVALVRPLPAAGVPTFAVLGNHDYSIDVPNARKNAAMARTLRTALEAAGVRVLHNAAVPLRARRPAATDPAAGAALGPTLYLVGVASHWADEDDPVAAVARVPAGQPYLVFMHNPNSFERLPAGAAPLAFAGHTHGGQVRLPFTPDWSWLTFVRDDRVHADGWSPPGYGAPGNRLYVNRGIGLSEVPLRLNCRPELTLVTLRRAR